MPITRPSGAISSTVMATFNAIGSHTSAPSSQEATSASRAASIATEPSALMRRPSSSPSTRRLKALPTPLDTSMEKITTVKA